MNGRDCESRRERGAICRGTQSGGNQSRSPQTSARAGGGRPTSLESRNGARWTPLSPRSTENSCFYYRMPTRWTRSALPAFGVGTTRRLFQGLWHWGRWVLTEAAPGGELFQTATPRFPRHTPPEPLRPRRVLPEGRTADRSAGRGAASGRAGRPASFSDWTSLGPSPHRPGALQRRRRTACGPRRSGTKPWSRESGAGRSSPLSPRRPPPRPRAPLPPASRAAAQLPQRLPPPGTVGRTVVGRAARVERLLPLPLDLASTAVGAAVARQGI